MFCDCILIIKDLAGFPTHSPCTNVSSGSEALFLHPVILTHNFPLCVLFDSGMAP